MFLHFGFHITDEREIPDYIAYVDELYMLEFPVSSFFQMVIRTFVEVNQASAIYCDWLQKHSPFPYPINQWCYYNEVDIYQLVLDFYETTKQILGRCLQFPLASFYGSVDRLSVEMVDEYGLTMRIT